MPTLLALHAHPDDESSKGAATVARYAAAGVRCVLITFTGGEAGDILNPAMDLPEVRETLAEYRRRELAEATAILGYDEVVEMGYRDSGMPDTEPNAHPDAFVNADFDTALGRLVAEVRRVRPEVVMGYDAHEFYPHPDHLLVHRLGLEAFTAAGDAARFPEAGPPWQPQRLVAPVFTVRRAMALHNAALARGLESPFHHWLDRIDAIGDDPPGLVAVEVAETMEAGREALKAHRTQIDPEGVWFSLPTEAVIEVYPYEDFEVLAEVAPFDRDAGDLFAGLGVV